MIDDSRLGLQPFSPTGLADFSSNFLAEFRGQRREAQRRALLSATGTFDFVWHRLVNLGSDYSAFPLLLCVCNRPNNVVVLGPEQSQRPHVAICNHALRIDDEY
jgi:hypothetical protein